MIKRPTSKVAERKSKSKLKDQYQGREPEHIQRLTLTLTSTSTSTWRARANQRSIWSSREGENQKDQRQDDKRAKAMTTIPWSDVRDAPRILSDGMTDCEPRECALDNLRGWALRGMIWNRTLSSIALRGFYREWSEIGHSRVLNCSIWKSDTLGWAIGRLDDAIYGMSP